MRNLPNFFGLRAFEAAARLGSFNLASEELHVTPSAISHQVRALEEQLGRSLFRRRNRRIELTADGARLRVGLSGAFDAMEAACAEFMPVERRKSLVVYSSPSFASKWLGPRLKDFMTRHPAMTIKLLSDAEPIDLLRNESIDIGISYARPVERPGVVVEPLGEEEVTAFCTPAMAAEVDPADPASFARLTLIDSSVSPIRWPDWFALNGLPEPPWRERPSFDRGALVISAAAQGLGVALESRRFALEELARGELVELGDGKLHGLRRAMHFLHCRDGQKDVAAVAAFRTWLLASARDV